MEIIIGAIPAPPAQAGKLPEKQGPTIEARILHARPPRKGIAGPSGMERRGKSVKDPHKGRVLTIMVPDGTQLPADINEANYSVYMRLVRK